MAETTPDSARPIRVLIVDDEPLIRWALAETLTGCGCRIVEACDARTALGLLGDGSRPFDVVLLDYHLPDTDDLTLLAATTRLSPQSQVIMITAWMTPDVATRALGLGAYQVLPKPVELDAVASLVLEAHHARHMLPPAGHGD